MFLLFNIPLTENFHRIFLIYFTLQHTNHILNREITKRANFLYTVYRSKGCLIRLQHIINKTTICVTCNMLLIFIELSFNVTLFKMMKIWFPHQKLFWRQIYIVLEFILLKLAAYLSNAENAREGFVVNLRDSKNTRVYTNYTHIKAVSISIAITINTWNVNK